MNQLQKSVIAWFGAPADISVADALTLLLEKCADHEIGDNVVRKLLNETAQQDAAFRGLLKTMLGTVNAKLAERDGRKAGDDDDDDGTPHLTADELHAEVTRRTNTIFEKRFSHLMQYDDDDSDKIDAVFGTAARAHQQRQGGGKSGRVDSKAPSARYSTKRHEATHVKSGKPVYRPDGAPAMHASERDMAITGALIRQMAFNQLAPSGASIKPLSEHERELIGEACATEKWCGKIGEEYVKDYSVKNTILLNDTLSGGNYLNPLFFDDAIVDQLLLQGELFPLVDIKDIGHGTQIISASVGNPTATWNTSPGASIPLFITDGLISQITGTVFDVDILLEISLNLLNDSPVNVGNEMTEAISRRMAAELDKVIAVGDGVTQPQGVVNAPGINVVNSVNQSAGPWTAKDTENMVSAIPKQYRGSRSKPNISFCSSDGLYWRIRGIQVSGTDQRRIYGYNYEAYELASRPWRISNDLSPAQIFFGDLSYYRMWRRMGLQLQFSNQGLSLMQNKAALLLGRARMGGKVVQPAAFSLCSDAQHS